MALPHMLGPAYLHPTAASMWVTCAREGVPENLTLGHTISVLCVSSYSHDKTVVLFPLASWAHKAAAGALSWSGDASLTSACAYGSVIGLSYKKCWFRSRDLSACRRCTLHLGSAALAKRDLLPVCQSVRACCLCRGGVVL